MLSPLVGYSFIQAVALYAEASRPALSIPELARQLSPFDGILVPTFGGFYLAITLLFPFIAIRLIAAEKASGGLKLLVQLPYRTSSLIAAKLTAVAAAWWAASILVLCSLVLWKTSGGHLSFSETSNLVLGHLVIVVFVEHSAATEPGGQCGDQEPFGLHRASPSKKCLGGRCKCQFVFFVVEKDHARFR